MSSIARTSAGALFGVALYLNLVGLIASEGVVGQNLSSLAQPLATLFAGIVGLGAIAYQARVGFANLLAAQEHKAKLDVLQKKYEQDEHQQQCRRSILAELNANFDLVTQFINYCEVAIAGYRDGPDFGNNYITIEFEKLRISRTIYDAGIVEMSTFNIPAAATLIKFYHMAGVINEGLASPLNKALFLQIYESLVTKARNLQVVADTALLQLGQQTRLGEPSISPPCLTLTSPSNPQISLKS